MDTSDRLLNDAFEGVDFENGIVLLDQEVGGVPAVVQDHVGLPRLVGDAPVNAPPEIVLVLASPSKNRHAFLSKSGRNFVLSTVNVTCCPTDL